MAEVALAELVVARVAGVGLRDRARAASDNVAGCIADRRVVAGPRADASEAGLANVGAGSREVIRSTSSTVRALSELNDLLALSSVQVVGGCLELGRLRRDCGDVSTGRHDVLERDSPGW